MDDIPFIIRDIPILSIRSPLCNKPKKISLMVSKLFAMPTSNMINPASGLPCRSIKMHTATIANSVVMNLSPKY